MKNESKKSRWMFVSELVMEIISDREVNVEGCRGVIEYDESFIKLNAGKGTVTLFGGGLIIESYSDTELLIKGKLEKIEFCM